MKFVPPCLQTLELCGPSFLLFEHVLYSIRFLGAYVLIIFLLSSVTFLQRSRVNGYDCKVFLLFWSKKAI